MNNIIKKNILYLPTISHSISMSWDEDNLCLVSIDIHIYIEPQFVDCLQ